MRNLVLVSLIVLLSPILQAEEICLSADGNFNKPETCVELASLERIEVPARSSVRRFLFTHNARQGFVIGVQPAGQSVVDLHVGGGALQLMLAGAKVPGWPLETKFEIVNAAGQSWRWTFTAEQVREPITVVMGPGRYTYALTAGGRELLRKEIVMPAGPKR